VWDVIYGACNVRKLATQNGCGGGGWKVPGYDTKHGPATSINNADSWAFFASVAYFQKAMGLTAPGQPEDDCDINNTALNIAELAAGPEGIHYPSVNRNDSTYNATAPPDPAPENTPPEDPPTPVLPYTATTIQSGLAAPFDAAAYFSTFVPAGQSTAASVSASDDSTGASARV
jgi:hypothetical protein